MVEYTIRCKDCSRYSTVTIDEDCELNCPMCMSECLVVLYRSKIQEPEDKDGAYDEWKDNRAMGYED
ncbi:hypothetical protein MKL26_04560 [Streptococcus suis]|nr:hypothetical protein [Streptococcus suis]